MSEHKNDIKELDDVGKTVPPVRSEHAEYIDEQLKLNSEFRQSVAEETKVRKEWNEKKYFAHFIFLVFFGGTIIFSSFYFNWIFYDTLPYFVGLLANILIFTSGLSLLIAGIKGAYKNRDKHFFYFPNREDNTVED